MRHHFRKVLGGEYDVPYRATRPVILDTGANVGSFRSLGAPLARLPCPLLRTASRQFRAAEEIEGASVSLHNFAVGDPSLEQLYLLQLPLGERASPAREHDAHRSSP